MRYWFNEGRNELFEMEIPPIDLKDCVEVKEADYNAYMDIIRVEQVKAETLRLTGPTEIADPTMSAAGPSSDPVTVTYTYADEAPPTQPVLETASVDMEKLARVWRKMQDAIDKLTYDYSLAKLEIENQQTQIGTAMLAALNKMGGTKLTTAAGIIEKKESFKVNVSDWGAYYRCIVENDAWELLEKRPGRTAVQRWVKSHDGALPPGSNAYREFKVTVTKPGSKEPPKAEE